MSGGMRRKIPIAKMSARRTTWILRRIDSWAGITLKRLGDFWQLDATARRRANFNPPAAARFMIFRGKQERGREPASSMQGEHVVNKANSRHGTRKVANRLTCLTFAQAQSRQLNQVNSSGIDATIILAIELAY